MSNGPVEPNADARVFAGMCFQWYTALVLEGFTEAQALVIVGQLIAAATNGGAK